MKNIEIRRSDNGTVEIRAAQEIDHDQADALFRTGKAELADPSCQCLVIDLRSTRLLENYSLYKIYKLIHILQENVDQHEIKPLTTVLYTGETKKRQFLEETVNLEGIRLRFSEGPTNKQLRQKQPCSSFHVQ
ncbi:hypothetical protein [Desulfogranum marinum]|uniref:hypothetical protein n=1 Tax=Desulfogranum marinum TaxID=453220 RepID=UPI0029C851A7|nr:hypothetical protein [Desulfogranum marinum]